MANVRTYTLKIDGVDTSITNINQLKQSIAKLEADAAAADFGSAEFEALTAEANKARAALAEVQQQMDSANQAANTAGQAANQMGGQFNDAFSLASLAGGETGEVLQRLGGVTDLATSAVGKLKAGFGSLKLAFASLGIGLLLVAFGALVTYLSKSQEGIDFVNRKTAALQAVFSLVTDKVIQFGKFLFEALSNPKQAITDLVDAIENNLINRIKSFGVILDALRNRDFSKLTDGFIQMGTGITDASSKVKGLTNNVNQFISTAKDAAIAAENIAKSNQQIAREEAALNVERARSRARIEELKKSSDDVTKSNQQRVKDAKEAETIERGLIDKQVSLQDRKIANLKAEMSLRKNVTNAEKQELNELQVERANTAQESFTVQTELQNKINGLNLEAKAKRIADVQAANAAVAEANKIALAGELEANEKNFQKILQIKKAQAAQDTKNTLHELNEKYKIAGAQEKAALSIQREAVVKEGQRIQTKLEADYSKEKADRDSKDTQAANAAELAALQSKLDRELASTEFNEEAILELKKEKLKLDTRNTIAGLDDKYKIAGEAEKKAIVKQKEEVIAAGIEAEKKLTSDYTLQQVTTANNIEHLKSEAKLSGLKEGHKEYYEELIKQSKLEEEIAVLAVKNSTKSEEEKQAEINKIQAAGTAVRKKLFSEEVKAISNTNVGTSILTKLFGVDDEQIDDVKQNLAAAFDTALGLYSSLLASQAQARTAAIEAAQAENDAILESAKSAADDLQSQLDESDSRIDELQASLAGTAGTERQAILDHLAEERRLNQQLAADKAKEDARIKAAEANKLELEKKKTAEGEKQQKLQLAMNALQAISAAIGATEAAVTSVKAIASAGAGGKFGFDNIAYILAATAAMAAAFVAIKSAASGFAEGGFTGAGEYPADHTGFKVAGVVHEGEWVAPKWMVTDTKFKTTIGELEAARQTGKGYAQGGYGTSTPVPVFNTSSSSAAIQADYQKELISLRQDMNAALDKPTFIAQSEYRDYESKTVNIREYFTK